MMLKWITELQSMAQTGLAFANNEFDKQRYIRLMEIASEMASETYDIPKEKVKFAFMDEVGYATPKIDVRAFIYQGGNILLVKEKSDNCWALPGGWVDVNESAADSVIRETFEETGYHVEVVKLIAYWDKLKHDHPPQWPHAHKVFFHCTIIGGEARPNIEVSEIKYFPIADLPELSTHRVTASQIIKLRKLIPLEEKTAFD